MQQAGRETRSSWGAFVRRFAPLFACSFLGLSTVRVWLQCCVYDLYAATDSGMATVAVNLARGAFTLILMAIALRRPLSPQMQSRMGVASAVAMTITCVLLLAAGETGASWLGWAACAFAALGVVWGGGMWIVVFERFEADEAALYAFASLAASCLAGLVLGFLPKTITMLVAAFMPALSLVTFRASMARLDEREGARGDSLPGAGARSQPPALPYDAEPRMTFVRLLAGVALFSLALGFARGFPYGQAIELSPAVRALHQLATCLLCLAVVWWGLVGGHRVRLSTLWNAPLGLLVIGVLLLASLAPEFMQAGSALVTVANTFTLAVLWYAAYDVARNMSTPAYLVLGAVWVAHQVPREIGRLAAMAVGPYDSSPMLLAVCMVVLLAGSMFLLVNDSIPHTRPLFAGLGAQGFAGSEAARTHMQAQAGDAHAAGAEAQARTRQPNPLGGAADNAGPAVAGANGGATEAGGNAGPGEARLLLLGQRYELTRRELDIARLLVRDLSKAQIGEVLCLSESTVRTHARNLYAKLDVHSREQLKELVRQFEA